MFYDIFAELCKRDGITPFAFSKAAGIGHSTIAMWKKTGATPKEEALRKVADYFSVSTDYLLGIEKAATLSDDGWSAQKKALHAAVDNMTEEQAAAFLALWEQFKAEK